MRKKITKRFEYGNPNSLNVLLQMVDDHDLSVIENEVKAIKEETGDDFCLVALKVNDWNKDLSPWSAPAVFGNEPFGGGAKDTLPSVLAEMGDPKRRYYIGGYSLAGLFALWAAAQTDQFKGVAAASPSVWFPGFLEYIKENDIRTDTVYLSLGDKEEKTKNPVMKTVGDNIKNAHELLKAKGKNTILEWNPGNHFKDPEERCAKGIRALIP